MTQLPLKVLLISGSAEYPSRTRATLDCASHLLRGMGVITYEWDLSLDPLPLFDPRYYPDPYSSVSEAVKRLAQLADQAHAFIWGSPVYHNSFSGVLKNTLDCLSIQQFRNKPVAFISSGNNDRTGSQPCDQLRIVARSLLALAIPTQLVTIPTDFTYAEKQYHLVDEATCRRLEHLTTELVAYTQAMRSFQSSAVEVYASSV